MQSVEAEQCFTYTGKLELCLHDYEVLGVYYHEMKCTGGAMSTFGFGQERLFFLYVARFIIVSWCDIFFV
jgi:hypothetical protein